MTKLCTSLDQSKKLLELGIDVNTADMYYDIDPDSYYGIEVIQDSGFIYRQFKKTEDFNDCRYLPAWSLTALLNIIKNRKDCNKVELFSNYASKWVLTTTYYDSIWKEKEIIAEDSIDAAFEMIVLLKENGKI